MVFALVMINALCFAVDKFTLFDLRVLYLNHYAPQAFQFVTSTLCHASTQHLSSNMFPLLVFGKLVEDEMGPWGLLVTYIMCGVCSNLASVFLLPSNTMSLGASGAVFGLFTVAVATRVSLRNFSWRSWIEALVFGNYVWEKLLNEVAVTSRGGIVGVNHVAHLGGAAAGLLLAFIIRAAVKSMDKALPEKKEPRQRL